MQKTFVVRSQGSEAEYNGVDDFQAGDKVIVENGGNFLGTVVSVNNEGGKNLEMILRCADEADLKKNEENKKLLKDALIKAKQICRAHNKDMKVLSSEYSLGQEKLVLTFSSENRVDFRDLVKELASAFKARIELKQVGQRDEAKLIGGLGPCGMQCCCNRCPSSETPFTGIKMAKNQNLSLAPQKINGLCGKIMCCVSYENDHYCQTMKEMPKMGSQVGTPDGKGTVTGYDCLRRRVNVKVMKNEDGYEIKNYALEELKFEKQSKHFDEED